MEKNFCSCVWILILLLFNAFALSGIAQGQSVKSTAKDVIDRLIEANHVKSEQVTVAMKLYDGKGKQREATRRLRAYYSNEKAKGESKALFVFEAPNSLQGTKILTLQSDAETGQWVYLSSLKKVTRITSGNESENILDSDLSYEDLQGESHHQYEYKFLEGEQTTKIANESCNESAYAILASSREKKSKLYGQRILFISQSKPVLCRIDFYGQGTGAKRRVKSIVNSGYVQDANYWRPQ